MTGIYGIFGNEGCLDRQERLKTLSRMSSHMIHADFRSYLYHGQGYSIGLSVRGVGENLDLCARQVDENALVVFCGYGKPATADKFVWAAEMAEHIANATGRGVEPDLAGIEGSYLLVLLKDNKLTIQSDRCGSKKLFYFETSKFLLLGPTVGCILASGLAPREKNWDAAKQVLVSGFFLDDSTLTKNVFHFPFATQMTMDLSKSSPISLKRYWSPPKRDGKIDRIDDDLLKTFCRKMEQAIYGLSGLGRRFVIPLSGGLDSRAIACYLARRGPIKTLTYDTKEEASIARKVCKALKTEFFYFSDDMMEEEWFRRHLDLLIRQQERHCVVNQYFYEPLRKYFMEVGGSGVFDGIYLDEMFSSLTPKYDNGVAYDFDRFLYTYGGRSLSIICRFMTVERQNLVQAMKRVYEKTLDEFGEGDAVAKSQLFYIQGRLRRNVSEAICVKENYCYVLKPGYDHGLMDFAFTLNQELRGGKLYLMLLRKEFPEIMKIRYKDSYGNRKERFWEKVRNHYVNGRLRLANVSRGRIRYTVYQINEYFGRGNRIDDYKDIFLNGKHLKEIMGRPQMEDLFRTTKEKHYLFSLFQRVMFLEQFYTSHKFSE